MRIDNPIGLQSALTGSFTGSFIGDGSGLTGLAAGIFAKTGSFQNTTNNLEITGSIIVTSSGSFGRVNASVLSGSFVGDGSNLTGLGGGGIFAVTGSSYNTTNNLEISGSLKTTGNVTVGGTLTEVSTRELKDSIILLSDQLSNVERLEPVSFVWKGTQEEDIGFIAEDVEEIYPVLVTKSEDGKVEGLHYTKLTSILVKAVQELSDRVKALENQVKS